MKIRWPRSIRGRLLVLAALWLGAALFGAWLAIGAVLNQFVTDRFDAELSAAADVLTAGLEGDDGRLGVTRHPPDPSFDLPLSGWYWQVSRGGVVAARSESLFDAYLSGPRQDQTGLQGRDLDGAALRVLTRLVILPDDTDPAIMRLTAPQSEIDAALTRVRRPLALSLLVLGLGLGLASVIQVSAGLASLRRLQADISAIRAGQRETLPAPEVRELYPVTQEMNALLDANRVVIARAREHLGNLAHSLKTPLAALAGHLPADHPGQALIDRMDRQIVWHLRRARNAASHRLLGHSQSSQRVAVAEVAQDIVMVLRARIEERGLRVESNMPADLCFAGERQDLEEMIGNLVENAVKWARGRVRLSALRRGNRLVLMVEDDGPGMPETDYAQALTRGARLDERGASGSGLGLAIVADLVALHGGGLQLANTPLGGLRASLTLPAS